MIPFLSMDVINKEIEEARNQVEFLERKRFYIEQFIKLMKTGDLISCEGLAELKSFVENNRGEFQQDELEALKFLIFYKANHSIENIITPKVREYDTCSICHYMDRCRDLQKELVEYKIPCSQDIESVYDWVKKCCFKDYELDWKFRKLLELRDI